MKLRNYIFISNLLCAFLLLPSAPCRAQSDFLGVNIIEFEHDVFGRSLDQKTGKLIDWEETKKEYARMMSDVLQAYLRQPDVRLPLTTEGEKQAVRFFQQHVFEAGKYVHNTVYLISQTVTERQIDCDMACLYIVDFLHALGVPLHDMGLLTIEDMHSIEGHVIVRVGERYYEPEPVLKAPDSNSKYRSYSRMEVMSKYPDGYLFSATDSVVTQNWLGVVEAYSWQVERLDPFVNGPEDTGAFHPYPELPKYLRQCNLFLDEALPFAEHAVEQHPRCADLLSKLGTLQSIKARTIILSGDTAAAILMVQTAIENLHECTVISPWCVSARMNLAMCYDSHVLHIPEAAITESENALSMMPPDGTYERSVLLGRIEKWNREMREEKK